MSNEPKKVNVTQEVLDALNMIVILLVILVGNTGVLAMMSLL